MDRTKRIFLLPQVPIWLSLNFKNFVHMGVFYIFFEYCIEYYFSWWLFLEFAVWRRCLLVRRSQAPRGSGPIYFSDEESGPRVGEPVVVGSTGGPLCGQTEQGPRARSSPPRGPCLWSRVRLPSLPDTSRDSKHLVRSPAHGPWGKLTVLQ